MCLTIDRDKTEKIKNTKDKNKKFKLKKVLWVFFDSTKKEIVVKTPYQFELVEGGWLKAKGKPQDNCGYIESGAIHAYNTSKNTADSTRYVPVNAWAYVKDFIAYGTKDDIAFTKIWIPIEEIERIKRNYRRKHGIKTN